MSDPQISVVIPCYNAGSWLVEAVQSALRAQDVPLEVIVVDDGSTEQETKQALVAAEREGATVIRTANRGVSSARNTAIQAARGRIIVPLDADDHLTAQECASVVSDFDRDPQVGIVAGAQRRFGAEVSVRACSYTGLESMLQGTTIPNTSYFLREDWATVGGYPEDLTICEDWAFWMRLLKLGRKVVVRDEILHEYRISEKQVTRNPDEIALMKAQNLVLRENAEIFPLEYIVEIATHCRAEAAYLRKKYGWIDSIGRRTLAQLRRSGRLSSRG